jgi:hypothetical protein
MSFKSGQMGKEAASADLKCGLGAEQRQKGEQSCSSQLAPSLHSIFKFFGQVAPRARGNC